MQFILLKKKSESAGWRFKPLVTASLKNTGYLYMFIKTEGVHKQVEMMGLNVKLKNNVRLHSKKM